MRFKVTASPPQKSDYLTEQAPTTKASSSSNDSNESEGKPLLTSDLIYGRDGKHLKPLQLTFVQVMLGNFKILESIMSKSPSEVTDYISYLKFLAIKGILAFDQDYDATKSWDNISMGTWTTLLPSIFTQQLPDTLFYLLC